MQYTDSMRRPSYTQREDETIIKYINSNPKNHSMQFDILSSILPGRTAKGISQRYYKVLKDLNKNIAVASNTGVMMLGKNAPRTNVVPESGSVRDAMLITAFAKLSKEQAIKFFLNNLSKEQKIELLIRVVQKICV